MKSLINEIASLDGYQDIRNISIQVFNRDFLRARKYRTELQHAKMRYYNYIRKYSSFFIDSHRYNVQSYSDDFFFEYEFKEELLLRQARHVKRNSKTLFEMSKSNLSHQIPHESGRFNKEEMMSKRRGRYLIKELMKGERKWK